mmetsp:Transcript_27873/g.38917  ORF Transcript_27873/g.38917 Transcript_27873/m.38917 type:complete len:83 (-) Transcript_27873:723-971(-)
MIIQQDHLWHANDNFSNSSSSSSRILFDRNEHETDHYLYIFLMLFIIILDDHQHEPISPCPPISELSHPTSSRPHFDRQTFG